MSQDDAHYHNHQNDPITPEKEPKSRQMQFHDKTAYVWGLRYWWDPSLLMNPFVGSRTLCHPGCYTDCVQAHKQTSQFQVDHPLLIILKVLECVFNGFPFQIKNFRQDIIKKHLQSSPSVLKNWSIDECEKQSDKMKQLVQTCEQRWWWPSALDTNGGGQYSSVIWEEGKVKRTLNHLWAKKLEAMTLWDISVDSHGCGREGLPKRLRLWSSRILRKRARWPSII